MKSGSLYKYFTTASKMERMGVNLFGDLCFVLTDCWAVDTERSGFIPSQTACVSSFQIRIQACQDQDPKQGKDQ